ncbi:MAG: DUF1203 domain-containing protein [Pseudomonadota bacterium]
MTFQIQPLPLDPFEALFALDDDALAERGARRVRADSYPGFPCRVTLEDAAPGEEVILANHLHQPANSPYRASHAVYVRAGARPARPAPGTVPDMLQRRTLALRGFDADGMMATADIVEGPDLAGCLDRVLSDPEIAYAHIHFAARGCYAARAVRAEEDRE